MLKNRVNNTFLSTELTPQLTEISAPTQKLRLENSGNFFG
jgi:hypothetical protein